MKLLEWLAPAMKFGPLLFGVGFVAPLVAQSLDAVSMTEVLGLTSLQLGLAVGVVAGAVATLRGVWV